MPSRAAGDRSNRAWAAQTKRWPGSARGGDAGRTAAASGGGRRRVLGGPPGGWDRPPNAEVMAEMRIVDRNDPIEAGEHPQKPGAAAARGPEDPGQPTRRRHGDF